MEHTKRDGEPAQGDRRSENRRRSSSGQTRRLNSAYTASRQISTLALTAAVNVPRFATVVSLQLWRSPPERMVRNPLATSDVSLAGQLDLTNDPENHIIIMGFLLGLQIQRAPASRTTAREAHTSILGNATGSRICPP